MLGVLLNLILGLSRVLLAMGRRRDMPSLFAKLDKSETTPFAAVIMVGVVIAGLVLIGDVKITWSFSAFTVLIYYPATWTDGRTDAFADRHDGHSVHTTPFTDAFPEDYEWDDERLADNRAVVEYLRNDRDDADDWAADVIEAAGSLRPKLRPAKPAPDPVVAHAPFPCPTYGKRTTPLGLPYKPIRQVRKTDNGVEMLVGHEFATL